MINQKFISKKKTDYKSIQKNYEKKIWKLFSLQQNFMKKFLRMKTLFKKFWILLYRLICKIKIDCKQDNWKNLNLILRNNLVYSLICQLSFHFNSYIWLQKQYPDRISFFEWNWDINFRLYKWKKI